LFIRDRLMAAATAVYVRSRRAPVDHHNVNAEWDPVPQDEQPRVPARTAS
jgi:PiT family inorganic phosphate transporter